MTIDIKVYRDLMGENDRWAEETRNLLEEKGVRLINMIGSPGSGKTLLLEATSRASGRGFQFAVLEGDVETTRDAERLVKAGCMASQLLSGGACHLEAKLVHYALRDLPLERLDLVIVENVGNMVCPAEFDIGEHAKVAILSVTEGEDKPIKYPLLYRESKAAVLTKTDLLPHLQFDMEACLGFMHSVNPELAPMQVSALTGDGMEDWIQWLAGLSKTL